MYKAAVVFILLGTWLYGEAPELSRVMPNSWQKVSVLDGDERYDFETANRGLLKQAAELIRKDAGSSEEPYYRYTTIYREQVGGDTFYRVIYTALRSPDFTKWGIEDMIPDNSALYIFYQALIHENRLILISKYHDYIVGERTGNRLYYAGIDIIRSGEDAKGILLSSIEVR